MPSTEERLREENERLRREIRELRAEVKKEESFAVKVLNCYKLGLHY